MANRQAIAKPHTIAMINVCVFVFVLVLTVDSLCVCMHSNMYKWPSEVQTGPNHGVAALLKKMVYYLHRLTDFTTI